MVGHLWAVNSGMFPGAWYPPTRRCGKGHVLGYGWILQKYGIEVALFDIRELMHDVSLKRRMERRMWKGGVFWNF